MIEQLNSKAKLSDVIAKINEMIDAQNKASDRRGPKSDREMTHDDARRIMKNGDARSDRF